MTSDEIYSKLHDVFQNIFGDDAPFPTPDMTADDVEGWDSLNHVRLIIAVEQAFGIRFTTMEIANLKNVGELAEVIAGKGS